MNLNFKEIKMKFLQFLVRKKKLSPIERLSSRVGYMGAGFLMAGQWTIEPILFIMGFAVFFFKFLFVSNGT